MVPTVTTVANEKAERKAECAAVAAEFQKERETMVIRLMDHGEGLVHIERAEFVSGRHAEGVPHVGDG